VISEKSQKVDQLIQMILEMPASDPAEKDKLKIIVDSVRDLAQNNPQLLVNFVKNYCTETQKLINELQMSMYFAEWDLVKSLHEIVICANNTHQPHINENLGEIKNRFRYALILEEALCRKELSEQNASKIFEMIRLLKSDKILSKNPLVATDEFFNIITSTDKPYFFQIAPFIRKENRFIKIVQRMATDLLDYYLDYSKNLGIDEIVLHCIQNYDVLPKYLILSDLSYPMGGGESYMLQTTKQMHEHGYDCYWVSSRDAQNGPYFSTKFRQFDSALLIDLPGGISLTNYLEVVKAIMPDVIHSHGGTNRIAVSIGLKLSIPTLVGFHFWTDLIKLGPTFNTRIRENYKKHKLDDAWMPESRFIKYYVASDYLLEVYKNLGGKRKLEIIYPLSEIDFKRNRTREENQYILQINLCKLKGGEIFNHLVEKLGDKVDFAGVITEPDDPSHYRKIRNSVKKSKGSFLLPYGDIYDYFINAKLVIIPTLVDETFCRVAYEAVLSGIPVFSTSNGFLSNMLGEAGHFLSSDPDAWERDILKFYNNDLFLEELALRQRAYVEKKFSEGIKEVFVDSLEELRRNAPRRNIGLFTLWLDQGMGIGSRNYSRVLRNLGYAVHILSFNSYSVKGEPLASQFDQSEWAIPKFADSRTHLDKIREEITTEDIELFILENNIGVFWQSEICWWQNWDRILRLSSNVHIVSVPCIEIVRKSEIQYHNLVDANFCVTKYTENELSKNQILNNIYIGHGIEQNISKIRDSQPSKTGSVRYLHIGGYNSKTRKKTVEILSAFKEATLKRSDIHLTILANRYIDEFLPYMSHSQITFKLERFAYNEIIEFYKNHDVTIQLSSHEGLGLGLYESLAFGTPVISHIGQPHAEAIRHKVAGWLIGADAIQMPDNDEAIVPAWNFHKEELVALLAKLEHEEIRQVANLIPKYFESNFSEAMFANQLYSALHRTVSVAPKSDQRRVQKIARKTLREWLKSRKLLFTIAYFIWVPIRKYRNIIQASLAKIWVGTNSAN